MLKMLLLMTLLTAPPTLEERLANLEGQIEFLKSIEVPADLRDEKEARISALRLELDGENIADASIDVIYDRKDAVRTWLLDNAVERPSLPPGEFIDGFETWTVKTPELTVQLNKRDLTMSVTTSAETWEFGPATSTEVELHDGTTFALGSARAKSAEGLRTGSSMGMIVSLSSFPAAPELELTVDIEIIGSEMRVSLVPVKDVDSLVWVEWPRSPVFGNDPSNLSVIPNMQGILVPGDWPQEIQHDGLVYSRTLTMPWWGQIRNGHGVLTFYESADDAGVNYHHPAGGPTRIQPRWYSSLGGLRYPRTVRYFFDDEADYVRMAKRYRRHLQETGQFLTLAQKEIEVPNVAKIIGRPYLWVNSLMYIVPGARFYREEYRERNFRMMTFDEISDSLRGLKDSGVDDVYLHLGGWNFRGYDNRHPDALPPSPEAGGWEGLRRVQETCGDLGYFFTLHDQYRDFYLDNVSFDPRMAVTNWDGTRDEHAEWNGGTQTYLSPWFQPGYVRRNHDLFAAHGIDVKGAYLDVFSVVPLEESFQRAHPVTRTDCARLRKECFALLRARGYILSSEEPTSYLAPDMHLVLRGSYPAGPKGYGAGEGIGIPVPLFNLVFHDSLIIPWQITTDGGWGIPKGDAGWLHCLLNAGMPQINLRMNFEADQLERLRLVRDLAKRVGTLEMVDHEFLDESRRVQRATYADGTTVTVDLEKSTFEVVLPDGSILE